MCQVAPHLMMRSWTRSGVACKGHYVWHLTLCMIPPNQEKIGCEAKKVKVVSIAWTIISFFPFFYWKFAPCLSSLGVEIFVLSPGWSQSWTEKNFHPFFCPLDRSSFTSCPYVLLRAFTCIVFHTWFDTCTTYDCIMVDLARYASPQVSKCMFWTIQQRQHVLEFHNMCSEQYNEGGMSVMSPTM